MDRLNYIGVFLTFRCTMGCSYCINHHGTFRPRKEISPWAWLEILKPIHTREDLPITLQGGEPFDYEPIYELIFGLHKARKKIDILTNGLFDIEKFLFLTKPEMFKRRAPYASIRFSHHQNTVDEELVNKVWWLQKEGYSVGIWGIDHPDMRNRNKIVKKECAERGIDYRMKEFLDETHGTYKYPDAVTGKKGIEVRCYPSEKLFAPDGKLYHCHHNLYSGKQEVWNPGGSMTCNDYGLCNPCDIKLKTNRLQEGGHCSVRIEK